MNIKSCFCLVFCMMLLGCPEEKTQFVDREMNLDLVACFGEVADVTGAQTCRTRLSDGVLDTETNGCLLIRVTDEDTSETHHRGVHWDSESHWYTLVDETPVGAIPGQVVEAEFYLFGAEGADCSAEGGPGWGTPCNADAPWCLVKMSQAADTVTGDGLSFDFGAASGQCAVSGPITENDEGSTETCDAADNDCDGEIDEGNPGGGVACQVDGETGVCSDGMLGCSDGQLTCTSIVQPTSEICDNLDNNCDGRIDESFSLGVACMDGLGACFAEGVIECKPDGTAGCNAQRGTPEAEVCDGIDNSCNGVVDEGFDVERNCTVGVGLCRASGRIECKPDQTSGCDVEPGEPVDEVCDGLDNDCDESTDEVFEDLNTACFAGVGGCLREGVLECRASGDGTKCSVLPGLPEVEICGNEIDDDCDEQVDESETDEDTTCDGIDDDCDGDNDEDYIPTIDPDRADRILRCQEGEVFSACAFAEGRPEVCDGLDNDCDNQIDQTFIELGDVCSVGVGACEARGTMVCTLDGEGTECDAQAGAATGDDDNCNNIDDDCDGNIDEGYVPVDTACGEGACAAAGVTACVGGEVQDGCVEGEPAANDATCDGIDDDCNGAADEDYVEMDSTCGVGACASAGTTACTEGVESDSCVAGDAAADDATCDGSDDDCDGTTDENYMVMDTACGVGACAAVGVTACVDGAPTDSCTAGAPADDDATCDGIDDDCSGAADEDYEDMETSCGVGACGSTGMATCVAGEEQDSCVAGEADPAETDATCDGVDDDCDGSNDEAYAPMPSTCGFASCEAAGETSCVDGAVEDSCVPGEAPSPDDATCDGVDDDCSGNADEDFAGEVTTCGVGACAAEGSTTCDAGNVVDTCTENPAAADDVTCDGIDDDCSGDADEDYVAMASSCGFAACAAAGMTSCVDGVEEDTCEPGEPASADDANCDGVDDDCSGAADEDYQGAETSCGTGACAAIGAMACVNGVETDTCEAGAPAADDATCDGVDDDCSGAADEDFGGVETACGVGACAAVGITTCAAGAETDSCEAGAPAADDATCDGVDDDCSGDADEDYVAMDTACGVGACAATGATTCEAGAVVDSCEAGAAAADDSTCDGIDDDCSGDADEDFASEVTTCGGVGACAGAGVTSCVAGAIEDSCEPGVESPEICDGVDNNCDGETDEALGNACDLGAFTNEEAQSLMDNSCGGCHTGGGSSGGLAVDDIMASVNTPSVDVPAMDSIEPGARLLSYIYHKIANTHGDVGGAGGRMPQGGALDAETVERFGLWIDQLQ